MTIPVTEILSEWTHNLKYDDIPAKTIKCAKEQVISIIAAIYAGSRTEECKPLYGALAEWDDKKESTVIGANLKSSMRHAGMANAVAAQTLEWEDYLKSQHSGASTVPTALAVAEALGVSGKEFLTALIVGNEISGRTGHAYVKSRLYTNSCPNHQIDTAFIAGKLFGLNKDQMMDAVGISCFPPMTQSFAGWFSPTKGFITGAPAYSGIMAASLAKHGFKGFRKIIEHHDGFSNAVFERYDLEEMVTELGSDWRTDTHSPKIYPCCGWLDALVDCVLYLMKENSIDWQEIKDVQVRCPTVTILLNKPKDELIDLITQIAENEYLTCVPLFFNSVYPLAAAIIDGELTEAQFTKKRIVDKKLHEMFDKIHFTADPSLDVKEMDEGVNSGEVTLTLQNGQQYGKSSDAMRGSYQNPIDIKEKLTVCTRNILSDSQRDELHDAVINLDQLSDIREFTKILL